MKVLLLLGLLLPSGALADDRVKIPFRVKMFPYSAVGKKRDIRPSELVNRHLATLAVSNPDLFNPVGGVVKTNIVGCAGEMLTAAAAANVSERASGFTFQEASGECQMGQVNPDKTLFDGLAATADGEQAVYGAGDWPEGRALYNMLLNMYSSSKNLF